MNAIVKVEKINKNNVYKIKELYNDCRARSYSDYKFELELLDFDNFARNIKSELLQGYFVTENTKPKAFLIYTESVNTALEINMIHCSGCQSSVEIKELLLKKLLENLNTGQPTKIISYPMLGIQSDFSVKIAEYGFKFVTQGVLRLKFNNAESLQVFKNANLKNIADDYYLKDWKDNYLDDASNIIFKEFSKAQDSKFDERFLSFEGSKSIVEAITTGIYGDFLPEAAKLLFFKDKCVGVCLVNLTIDTLANVPLIAVDSMYRNQNLGVYMLKNAINDLLEELNTNKLSITEINATADINNTSAIKMYKKLGFKIDFEYPHAYLKV